HAEEFCCPGLWQHGKTGNRGQRRQRHHWAGNDCWTSSWYLCLRLCLIVFCECSGCWIAKDVVELFSLGKRGDSSFQGIDTVCAVGISSAHRACFTRQLSREFQFATLCRTVLRIRVHFQGTIQVAIGNEIPR